MIDYYVKTYDDCFIVSEEWLSIEDYQFKVLILTAVLAENNLAFRGSLKTMRDWLGLKESANTNNKLKEAIENLTDQGYISYLKDGRTYTITLLNRCRKDKKIEYIRKEWVNVIKHYKNQDILNTFKTSWLTVLKVFIYIFANQSKRIFTAEKIAADLNISDSTVYDCWKILKNCCLDGVDLIFHTITDHTPGSSFYQTIGTEITAGIAFTKL